VAIGAGCCGNNITRGVCCDGTLAKIAITHCFRSCAPGAATTDGAGVTAARRGRYGLSAWAQRNILLRRNVTSPTSLAPAAASARHTLLAEHGSRSDARPSSAGETSLGRRGSARIGAHGGGKESARAGANGSALDGEVAVELVAGAKRPLPDPAMGSDGARGKADAKRSLGSPGSEASDATSLAQRKGPEPGLVRGCRGTQGCALRHDVCFACAA